LSLIYDDDFSFPRTFYEWHDMLRWKKNYENPEWKMKIRAISWDWKILFFCESHFHIEIFFHLCGWIQVFIFYSWIEKRMRWEVFWNNFLQIKLKCITCFKNEKEEIFMKMTWKTFVECRLDEQIFTIVIFTRKTWKCLNFSVHFDSPKSFKFLFKKIQEFYTNFLR
jgi:hypothetical protein